MANGELIIAGILVLGFGMGLGAWVRDWQYVFDSAKLKTTLEWCERAARELEVWTGRTDTDCVLVSKREIERMCIELRTPIRNQNVMEGGYHNE